VENVIANTEVFLTIVRFGTFAAVLLADLGRQPHHRRARHCLGAGRLEVEGAAAYRNRSGKPKLQLNRLGHSHRTGRQRLLIMVAAPNSGARCEHSHLQRCLKPPY